MITKRHRRRWNSVACACTLFAGLIWFSGCTGVRMKCTAKSPGSDGFTPVPFGNEAGKSEALVTVKTISNGKVANTPDAVKNTFIDRVLESNVFCKVSLETPANLNPDAVRLAFTVDEQLDTHNAGNNAKAVFVGLSLFLLAPVTEFTFDMDSTTTLEATRWDGEKKTYTARHAEAIFLKIASLGKSVAWILKTYPMNANALMSQMVEDAAFYRRK